MSVYPTTEEILASLTALANAWRPVAVFWHLYLAAFVIALILGVRPSKRLSGIILALPFLSVSILAWSTPNPVNGTIFAVIGILLIAISVRLPRESIRIAPLWAMIPGAFMLIFGWIYPHFLDASSPLSFLYSAPTGIIPCPTLSMGIGLALIMNGLVSRKLSLILGIGGIGYGITGAVQLGVSIDWLLLLGSMAIVLFALVGKRGIREAFMRRTTPGRNVVPISHAMKGGVLFFIGSVQFMIALTIAEALYPNYNLSANPLSDLGAAVFQPSSNIFNGSVIIFGLLIIVGAYFTMKGFKSRPLVTVLLLAGMGVAGVGIFTETILGPHLIFSFMAFFFSGLAAILSFKVINSPFKYIAAVLGIVALLALVLFVAGVDLGLGHGGIQRMIVYPALMWYLGFGANLMARSFDIKEGTPR